jgi:hypothetical protein
LADALKNFNNFTIFFMLHMFACRAANLSVSLQRQERDVVMLLLQKLVSCMFCWCATNIAISDVAYV